MWYNKEKRCAKKSTWKVKKRNAKNRDYLMTNVMIKYWNILLVIFYLKTVQQTNKFRFSRESRVDLSLTAIIPNRPEKVNLCTLFHAFSIAICYGEKILRILSITLEREFVTITPVSLLSSLIRFSSSQNRSEGNLSELNSSIYSLQSFSIYPSCQSAI